VTFTSLVNFDDFDGFYPAGTLVQGTDGNFYGTTLNGGPTGLGTAFSFSASGTLTTFAQFRQWQWTEMGLTQD